jgi:hypothetical protein
VAGKFFKGALISFMPTFAGSLPNVVVFQYNPETITHTWTAWKASEAKGAQSHPGANPQALDHIPGETFSFKLALDANDAIANSDSNPIGAGLAVVSGVYTRIAALEMLQYSSAAFSGLLGTVSAAVGSALSAAASALGLGGSAGASSNVPRSEVPTVLFVWGPQRIVPVRVANLAITETLYDALLNPIHADVAITLQVLTPEDLTAVQGELKQIATAAYVYSQGLRQAQALANLGDAAASIIGMLPSPF